MDFLTKIWTFGIVGFLQSSLKNKCNLGSYDPVFLLRRNSIGMTFWLLLDAFYERFFDLFMYPLSTQFPEIGCFCMQVRNFLFLLTVEVFQVILQLDLKLLMWFEEIRCLCNNSQAILKIELENESRNLSNRFLPCRFLIAKWSKPTVISHQFLYF